MIKIFRNFITLEECKQLSDIALDGVEEGWIDLGVSRGNHQYKKRLTSRMHMKDKKYPELVIDISNRIREFMGISHRPLIMGHGSGGVVVSVTYPGGDVYSHRDPKAENGWTTYRCNIMTQATEEGAELYVDDELVDINVGDLHCYYASEQTHYVTEVKGETPRILWMFGSHRPYEDFIMDQTP
jgi:hypothetical protein